MPVEEQAAMARSFVEGVVERLGIPASTTATVSEDEETIDIAVDGEGLGFLIGPHGSTLAALQDLTRTVVQRKTNDRGARILVDVASYRAKRAVALADFTRRIAGDVLASGAAAALEPMS
ncbi:MAG TPA: KH domain-containing protein, partial [Acidimicrobiales bacterium]|nr:KH domain-containing protein [Acidimicrobiales bacterium]